MIRFVRYAVLLLAGLALVVAWTAVDWGGSERTRVPAIELTPRERDGRQQPRRTGARRAERRETRSSPPVPAGDDDEPDDDEVEGDERDDGDDGDD